jgi:hypothetical protein
MDIKSAKIQLVLSDPRLFSSTSNNLGLPDEYSRILTFTETDTRIRTSSTATATHEYEYSQFANGLARIFVILATRATLYQQMVLDVTSFRDALEALAEHPKYDTYVACPALFNLPSLHESYESVRDIQIVCTKAKRAVLEHWGVMAWWTASVTEWGVDVPELGMDTGTGSGIKQSTRTRTRKTRARTRGFTGCSRVVGQPVPAVMRTSASHGIRF